MTHSNTMLASESHSKNVRIAFSSRVMYKDLDNYFHMHRYLHASCALVNAFSRRVSRAPPLGPWSASALVGPTHWPLPVMQLLSFVRLLSIMKQFSSVSCSFAAVFVCSRFRSQPFSFAAVFVCSRFRLQLFSFAAVFVCSRWSCVRISVYVCLYVCIGVYMCVCVCMCVCACVCSCACVCVCTGPVEAGLACKARCADVMNCPPTFLYPRPGKVAACCSVRSAVTWAMMFRASNSEAVALRTVS
jgi:hypothetical protein